jgi:hypothetical protein
MLGPSSRSAAVIASVAAAAMLLSGCASPFGRSQPDATSSTPERRLGKRAETVAESPSTGGGTEQGQQVVAASPTTAPGKQAITTSTEQPPRFASPTTTPGASEPDQPRIDRAVATATDAAGDSGLQGTPATDLAELAAREDGSSLAIRVRLHGALPPTTKTGEVYGVAVDLYRKSDIESDYQLFAEGASDGWFAYLQTPDGFVAYPGRFTVAGNTLDFTIPWTAIGGRKATKYTVFLDWSQKALPLNKAASDRMPDSGAGAFDVTAVS